MDEELDNIEQAREREHYSLDPRDQPFADDVDPDDESWRDEPEPEQDEEEAPRRFVLGVTVGGRDAAIAAADAKMRELTAMPADVQKAVDDGVWEES